MRSLSVALFGTLILVVASPAAPLQTDLFPLPAGSFRGTTERVSDVAPILRQYGFDLPEGSEATYQAPRRLLYVRSTRKDLNRLTRALEDRQLSRIRSVATQVSVTATCLAFLLKPDEVAALADFEPSPTMLAALPKEKLRLLDRKTIITRSGMRAKISNERDHSRDTSNDDEDALWPAPLSTLELDPVVGTDEDTIELNLAYEITQPLTEKDRARHAQLVTAITLSSGRSAILELGYLKAPEPHLLLLELKAKVIGAGGEGSPAKGAERSFPGGFFDKTD